MKGFAKAFYKSRAWQETRRSFIASVGGLCTRCQRHGMIVPGYIVHHIVPLTPQNINDPAIALSHNNLEYVCKACHDDEHLVNSGHPRCTYDAAGNPVERYSPH